MRGLWVCREEREPKHVHGEIAITKQGDAVLFVKETVEKDKVRIHGIVLGNVLDVDQRPTQSLPVSTQVTITNPSHDDDDERCSCCNFGCAVKWTVGIICLPFLPVICLGYYCYRHCKDEWTTVDSEPWQFVVAFSTNYPRHITREHKLAMQLISTVSIVKNYLRSIQQGTKDRWLKPVALSKGFTPKSGYKIYQKCFFGSHCSRRMFDNKICNW